MNISNNLVEYKGTQLSQGRVLFNKCLPEDYPVIDKQVDSSILKNVMNDIAFKYSPTVVIDTLNKIQKLGFMVSTITGFTLGIDDLYSENLENIAKCLTGRKDVDLVTLSNDEVMNALQELPFSVYINSGARGSWDQVKQLVLCRGYVADANGKIRDEMIRGSLVGGLTQDEFCNSSWGSRKGLLDTAMSTGDSGYLTRQLVYSTVGIEVDAEVDDCNTIDCLNVFVDDVRTAKTLLWRYHIRDDGSLGRINRRNYKELIGKNIKLRSPIYCKGKKICKKCYGDLHRILHSSQVGIIACQAIGERSVQLVLRSFHTSGVATIGADGSTDNQSDIVSGMGLANKLFHSPASLDIDNPADLVSMIHKLFNPYKGIHMVHYEIIVSAMMMSGNRSWRTCDNRDGVEWEWTSILKIPSQSSWLLGSAFSNLKNKLIEGVVHSRVDTPTIISDLFRL